MSRPSSMGDGHLFHDGFVDINIGGVDPLAEARDLSDFLEVQDLVGFVPIDTEARRVVPSVFLTGEARDEDVKNLFTALSGKVLALVCRHIQTSPKQQSSEDAG